MVNPSVLPPLRPALLSRTQGPLSLLSADPQSATAHEISRTLIYHWGNPLRLLTCVAEEAVDSSHDAQLGERACACAYEGVKCSWFGATHCNGEAGPSSLLPFGYLYIYLGVSIFKVI